ncbi:MAG: hypothetical protein FWD78_17405 [Treponema sp.]|nr:hypothetical protein [Treponema sp.]
MKRENLLSGLVSRLRAKSPGTVQKKTDALNRGVTELSLVFFITDWEKADTVSAAFTGENSIFHFISKARGTATSEVLDYLGIGESEKALIVCLEKPGMAPLLLRDVRKRLGRGNPGMGIAFTVPLSGINTPILKSLVTRNRKKNRKGAGKSRSGAERRNSHRNKHSVIISVINHGYADQLMNAALGAGASGGTVLNAHCQNFEGMVSYFGIMVQEERELVMILANPRKKSAIMEVIGRTCGMDSDARGVIFSAPVDRAIRLR